jgi:hypothetical protein
VGNNGTILTSPTGAAWTTETSGTAQVLSSIAYGGNNQFVAVGESGTILTSTASAIHYQAPNSQNLQQGIQISGNKASYTVNASVLVTIRLYDLKGRLIKTLLNDKQEAGEHGIILPYGIAQGRYILSYKAGEYQVSTPVLLMR